MVCASAQQHHSRKMQRQIVLAQHGQHVHAFLVRRAEHFNDFALGIAVARFPFAQFDHNFVAVTRRPAQIARRRHINIVRNTRIIRDDKKKLLALLQRADDLRALALTDAKTTVRVLGIAFAKMFSSHIAPHQHTVFVQRRDRDFPGMAISLRLASSSCKKTFTRHAVHADGTGNQVGIAGPHIADAFDLGDVAVAFQLAQRLRRNSGSRSGGTLHRLAHEVLRAQRHVSPSAPAGAGGCSGHLWLYFAPGRQVSLSSNSMPGLVKAIRRVL